MYQQGVNTGNALIAAQQGRESMYGDIGSALGKYLNTSYGGGGGGGTQMSQQDYAIASGGY
jgi:hypothetical protein